MKHHSAILSSQSLFLLFPPRETNWRFFFVKKGIGKHRYTGVNTDLLHRCQHRFVEWLITGEVGEGGGKNKKGLAKEGRLASVVIWVVRSCCNMSSNMLVGVCLSLFTSKGATAKPVYFCKINPDLLWQWFGASYECNFRALHCETRICLMD